MHERLAQRSQLAEHIALHWDHLVTIPALFGRTKRPTLAALDPDAQAVFCSFYRQDYECLGYALPPECRDTAPATQLCGIDHADRGGTARAISKRAQGQ